MIDAMLPEVASPLDAALRLELVETTTQGAILRLEPSELVATDGMLHGGAIATCVDTGAWYAVRAVADGDWVVASLAVDFLRPARPGAHRVTARCRRVGRLLAHADVELTPWDEPDRLVALGRASLARVDPPPAQTPSQT